MLCLWLLSGSDIAVIRWRSLVNLVDDMEGVAGDECGCLGAQAVVAHGDSSASGVEALFYFLWGEIPFGAYEQQRAKARLQCL